LGKREDPVVLVGETAARYITMAAILLSYLITIYLIFVAHFSHPPCY